MFDKSPAERMAIKLLEKHCFMSKAKKIADKHLSIAKTLSGKNHWNEVIAYIELHGRI